MPEPRWHLDAPDGLPVTTAAALDGAWRQNAGEPDLDLRAGTPVQVRNRFDGRWVSGFEVVDVRTADPFAYEIRRCSDRMVLPEAFAPTELRPEQRRA